MAATKTKTDKAEEEQQGQPGAGNTAETAAVAVKEPPQTRGHDRDKDKMPVRIFTAWCKGCGICAAYCPKKVLEMDPAAQKPIVANPVACIQCGLCEMRCPDLAITRTGKKSEGDKNGTK